MIRQEVFFFLNKEKELLTGSRTVFDVLHYCREIISIAIILLIGSISSTTCTGMWFWGMLIRARRYPVQDSSGNSNDMI